MLTETIKQRLSRSKLTKRKAKRECLVKASGYHYLKPPGNFSAAKRTRDHVLSAITWYFTPHSSHWILAGIPPELTGSPQANFSYMSYGTTRKQSHHPGCWCEGYPASLGKGKLRLNAISGTVYRCIPDKCIQSIINSVKWVSFPMWALSNLFTQ